MFRFATALLVAAGMALVVPVRAADKIAIGDVCPASFSKLEGVDGKKLSLDDLKTKDVIVVAITCNHCPVAVAYEDRMIAFAKKHAGSDSKVGFVAINVNTGEDDSLAKMKERAKDKGFNFPYCFDESQKIAKDLGATVTPEFYVFGKDRKLVYHGSFDDDQKKPTVNFLEEAVKAALDGKKPEKGETRPFGCPVKYNKN